MQMIDVLKRLAELDANNPNIVKESQSVEECGPMGMMGGMEAPHPTTPAAINITAGSGEELSDMLTAIMTLAGVNKAEPAHVGVDSEPAVMTAEPTVGDRDDMRSVLDKLHPETDDEEEETDEDAPGRVPGVDTTPADPNKKNSYDDEGVGPNNHENQPGAGDTPDGQRRSGFQPATFEGLMSEYKKFISEN